MYVVACSDHILALRQRATRSTALEMSGGGLPSEESAPASRPGGVALAKSRAMCCECQETVARHAKGRMWRLVVCAILLRCAIILICVCVCVCIRYLMGVTFVVFDVCMLYV